MSIKKIRNNIYDKVFEFDKDTYLCIDSVEDGASASFWIKGEDMFMVYIKNIHAKSMVVYSERYIKYNSADTSDVDGG